MKKNILIAVLAAMLLATMTFAMVQKAAADEAIEMARQSKMEAERQAALAAENMERAMQAQKMAEFERMRSEEARMQAVAALDAANKRGK